MRIISGKAGRRHIRVPGSVARPSTDRLREALFSILSERVNEAQVLDLFAGSGALGLECLSRGATSCVFVDDSRESQQVIKKNLNDLKLDGGRVAGGDVFRMLKSDRGKYDLIFADPPYFKQAGATNFVQQLLESETLPDRLADGGLLIVEDPPSNRRGVLHGWQLLDQRQYGGCGILFYQRPSSG
ncbi:MAG: 16S rRNA (guanine(966)-N(2))-methyltransferase RsmD [Verrucomicrobiae bacterium]|nr:16S rRNA (guanine(966)-N(2))-methyltransferase RsmD [Verrucomicrobiae bacterium]NNJ42203.1 16S rRNA (guanine(966)-N(2))-methyltransferase RsmD [Akkermansiaceae bacterium]